MLNKIVGTVLLMATLHDAQTMESRQTIQMFKKVNFFNLHKPAKGLFFTKVIFQKKFKTLTYNINPQRKYFFSTMIPKIAEENKPLKITNEEFEQPTKMQTITERKQKIEEMKEDLKIFHAIDELDSLKEHRNSLEYIAKKTIDLHEWILDSQEKNTLKWLVDERPFFDDFMDIWGWWSGFIHYASKNSIHLTESQTNSVKNLQKLILEVEAIKSQSKVTEKAPAIGQQLQEKVQELDLTNLDIPEQFAKLMQVKDVPHPISPDVTLSELIEHMRQGPCFHLKELGFPDLSKSLLELLPFSQCIADAPKHSLHDDFEFKDDLGKIFHRISRDMRTFLDTPKQLTPSELMDLLILRSKIDLIRAKTLDRFY